MKQKAFVLVPACIAALWLLFVSSAQSVTAGRGIVLRAPFDGTYRVTAYFDHDKPTYCVGANNTITIYNGESVSANCSAHTGEPYPYDGHDGWDFSMGTGTSVFAAASGQVVLSRDVWQGQEGFGKIIIISHDGAYHTMYAHLDARLVEEGESVIVGQYIARSGASGGVPAHLHFGVRHGGYANTTYATDPFGWRGPQRDPLYGYNRKESSCLWRGAPGDSISACAPFQRFG